jgi:hypothetical protein
LLFDLSIVIEKMFFPYSKHFADQEKASGLSLPFVMRAVGIRSILAGMLINESRHDKNILSTNFPVLAVLANRTVLFHARRRSGTY